MNTIVFIYNADSGLIIGLKDLLHQLISPSTYPCSLCGITYGFFGMRSEWRDFVAGLGREVKFLHKDELSEQHGINDVALPAAFTVSEEGQLSGFLDADRMNTLTTLDELKNAVTSRIDELN